MCYLTLGATGTGQTSKVSIVNHNFKRHRLKTAVLYFTDYLQYNSHGRIMLKVQGVNNNGVHFNIIIPGKSK